MMTVLALVKIQPKKVTLFVAESWKYTFYKKLQKELTKTRDISKLMKLLIEKKHAEEISRIIPSVVKNPSKMPETILDPLTETKVLQEMQQKLVAEFRVKVEILNAENSQLDKAKQSSPGKPAILVE